MAHIIADRVKETCSAPSGSAAFASLSTATAFQSFDAVMGASDTCFYAAEDASGNWETGLGTWDDTAKTLARTTILASSNSGSAETFSGTVTVQLVDPASQINRVRAVLQHGNVVASASGTTANNATFTEIVTGTETTDKEGWHSTSTGRITPTRAGLYLHYVKAGCTLGTSAMFIVGSAKNGASHIPFRNYSNSDADCFAVRLHYLNGSTDYVSIFAYQGSGSSKTITGDQALIYIGDNY